MIAEVTTLSLLLLIITAIENAGHNPAVAVRKLATPEDGASTAGVKDFTGNYD